MSRYISRIYPVYLQIYIQDISSISLDISLGIYPVYLQIDLQGYIQYISRYISRDLSSIYLDIFLGYIQYISRQISKNISSISLDRSLGIYPVYLQIYLQGSIQNISGYISRIYPVYLQIYLQDPVQPSRLIVEKTSDISRYISGE